jgi:hypothetical protein
MKIIKLIILLIIFVDCVTGNAQQTVSESGMQKQKYLNIEAQRRVSGPNGTIKYNPYEPFKTRTVQLLIDYQADGIPNLDKFGGLKDKKATPTGFFYVKKIGNRWWCVDPEGGLYINIALNSISTGKSERNKEALKTRFGTEEKWLSETINMLQTNGFNCAGSWSSYFPIIEANKAAPKPFAYTINWNFMSSYGRERGGTFQQPGHTGYPNDAIFVFDPGFETFCDRHAKQLIATKDDPNLFGHFSDNEMPFKFKSLDNFLALPENDFGHKAADNWMEMNRITKERITDEHRKAFMAVVAEKYFSVVSKAIKKYDPNHMYIGARFYSDEKNYREFMAIAGKYLDIISNNYYNHWTPDSTHMANWTNWSGKPFIVTEYYTKGEDSGMPNQSGAGWIVKTQRDRGLFYQNYNLALLESKNCVGWHYFKYQDNDPSAKGVDPSNIDANKGIVNNDYVVWEPMMLLMKELNTQVYSIIKYFDMK